MTTTATKTSVKKWIRATSNIYLAYSNSFNSSNVGKFYWSWILRLYESSGKEKESRCLEFTSSTKQEIRHFHVVVVQWRQRNVQISLMHVQSCCFANLNLSLFFRSRCRRSRRWLKLPNLTVHEPDITIR